MKIVRLKGGLGNQMFQYAFAKYLQMYTDDIVKLDLSYYGDITEDSVRQPRILKFNITLPIATTEDLKKICIFTHDDSFETKIYKIKLLLEKYFNNKSLFEKKRFIYKSDDVFKYQYYDGYWQSYFYADKVKDILIKEFTPNYNISNDIRKLIDLMKKQESVFIGIRRGDYLLESRKYGYFDNEYYYKAINYMNEHLDNPVFYVFSNDIEWVKKNMDFKNIKVNYRDGLLDDFEELLLMMNCRHSIIINSTYHWWGAYIYDNEDKIIIAPDCWFIEGKKLMILKNNWVSETRDGTFL